MDADEEADEYALVGQWQFYRNLLFIRDTVTPHKTPGNIETIQSSAAVNDDLVPTFLSAFL